MNLPGWDWKENILKPNAVFTNLHNYFMDIINNLLQEVHLHLFYLFDLSGVGRNL
jgi:hypothetical protein